MRQDNFAAKVLKQVQTLSAVVDQELRDMVSHNLLYNIMGASEAYFADGILENPDLCAQRTNCNFFVI